MLKRPGAIFILDDKRRKVRRWLQSNAAPAVSVVQSSGISGETSGAGRGAAEIRQQTEGGGSQGGSLRSPPLGSLTLCFLLPPPCVEKVILQHSKLGR